MPQRGHIREKQPIAGDLRGVPAFPENFSYGRAGDGTRTRDHLLGRQGLYQLSYSRKIISILADNLRLVKGGLLRQEN